MDGYVELRAYAELNDFLAPELRAKTIRRPVRGHQTVKDVVEAAGIPHTEVDLILVDGSSVRFEYRPAEGDRLAVYPVFESLDIGSITRLRPNPLRIVRFVVDVHLGSVARLLRLVGFDTWWENDLDDDSIVSLARIQHRIVVTQDRGLLKRRDVTHGVFVRPGSAVQQTVEVLRRLDVGGQLAPFTRCLRCGSLLADVAKQEVVEQLEPLTRRHVDAFRRCLGCGQIYWRGSHHDRLDELVTQIRNSLDVATRAGSPTRLLDDGATQ